MCIDLRLFAGRTWSFSQRMTSHSPFHQKSLSLTCSSTLHGLRHASSRTFRTSASTSTAKRKCKGSPTTSTGPSRRTEAAASSKDENAADLFAAEEHRLTENDVRLAMRTLMASHFSLVQHARKPEKMQVAKEREAIEEKHQGRQRRLLEKDENSLRLLGADGMVIGEGILPLLAAAKRNPYDATSSRRATSSPDNAAWRALNPVGLAASQAVASASLPGDGDDADALSEAEYASFLARSGAASIDGSKAEETETDAWKSATLATLSVPDLSVYDADHDFRINSEELVRGAGSYSSRAAPLSAGSAAAVQAERPDVPTGLDPLSTRPSSSKAVAAAMQLQLDEDEDTDYTVAAFMDDKDDPLDL
ncbi:conserved hypothetical protein [Leishmania infantum JPCM5]|uniref:Uncharacterized protein n=4 Tax=Leishmania donovani species complex TaxID=38574 RepID=A4I016_LEIIN|nr:conserved hypothetical protein [Leishmania infantum JPCM5]XP_003860888.1 hypothetical protein, conserved [Leishmania donovani]CAC9488584.1 hypothetical_protein_-_conserved [Leishmania infantum]AYU78858.1 hypothetical protein LdCL_220021500 [Leishmania donovani]CAM68082.1 conserved hypothetical protein [Leishmania infantum JPCM5]CBZ34183.1 hypothetical protein, conserved [Leishmania donovani]SUZ41860.1 hypothetical_protein_-_conserved [Leishmania infantum]|eukprot:XP_001465657.1 conserved hypothetical protein [Leishmania infantum JPCM5]